MKLLLAVTAAASLLLSSVEARWQPTQSQSFNILIGESSPSVSGEKSQIVDIDLVSKAAYIEKYHSAGKKVVCYLSGGTAEDWRPDYSEYKKLKGLVHQKYSDRYNNEYWVDYRSSEIRHLIEKRIQRAKNQNCDGIDVDNVDAYQIRGIKDKEGAKKNGWSSPVTKEENIEFLKWLGSTAHKYGLAIGLKNCHDIIDRVSDYFDFAINENCGTAGDCHYYKNFLKSGKPVFAITYNGMTSSHIEKMCKNTNGLPITMIVKPGHGLPQEKVDFDGHKHCGSHYSGGSKVSPPKEKEAPKVTTVKKTTTLKQVAKTTVRPVVTATKKIGAAVTPSFGNTTKGINPSTGSTTKGFNPSTGNTAKGFNPATGNTTKGINPSIVNGNGTLPNGVGAAGAGTPSTKKTEPKTEPKKVENKETEKKEKEKINLGDEQTANQDDGNGGTYAAVAATGSVVGAAALFVLAKKNPKKYDNIKRGISRRATTVKRGASTLSRKISTRRRI